MMLRFHFLSMHYSLLLMSYTIYHIHLPQDINYRMELSCVLYTPCLAKQGKGYSINIANCNLHGVIQFDRLEWELVAGISIRK